MRSARSGTLPLPTSAPAGFLSGVDDQLTEEQKQEEEMRSNVLTIHGNDRTFNLNTLLAQTILASEYFKSLVTLTTYLEVRANGERERGGLERQRAKEGFEGGCCGFVRVSVCSVAGFGVCGILQSTAVQSIEDRLLWIISSQYGGRLCSQQRPAAVPGILSYHIIHPCP